MSARQSRTDELCQACSKLDLSPLFQPPSRVSAANSLKEYEEQNAVWLPDNFYRETRRERKCSLCKLVAKCATRADVWKKHGQVSCCIRPIYTWKTVSQYDNAAQTGQTPAPIHSGRWLVWFYEVKLIPKFTRQESPPKSDKELSTALENFRRRFVRRSLSDDELEDEGLGALNPPSESSNLTGLGKLKDRLDSRKDRIKATSLQKQRVNTSIASWTVEAVGVFESRTSVTVPWLSARIPVREKIDLALVKDWLYDCDVHHHHLAATSVTEARLEEARSQKRLRAINTRTGRVSLLPRQTKFVALSYVWGKQSELPTSLQPMTEFPNAVRDAISLTRELGFQWLWVDRLCIRQDDEDEKLALIPIIKDIFASAELTIVAAMGDGAHIHLPGVGSNRDLAEKPYRIPHESTIIDVLPAPYSFNYRLEACHWRKRGWTFEEHVFARRLLFIFATEAMFSCPLGLYREAYGKEFTVGSAGSTWGDRGARPPTIEGLLHAKLNTPAGLYTTLGTAPTLREFVRAVEEYTARDLTFEEDRVKAFAGLVTATSVCSNPLEERHLLLHGHPLPFFETALTWHHAEDWPRRRATHGEAFAPTWSWASAGTKVQFLDNGEEHTRCEWFKYQLHEGFDVFGVLAEKDIPIVADLDLESPPAVALAGHDTNLAPPAYDEISNSFMSPHPTRLPRLHLVTVIFAAIVEPSSYNQYSLRSIDSNEDTHAKLLGNWSIDESVSIEEGQAHEFAVVAGGSRMYVMLLLPGTDNFRRGGLFRLSLGPFGSTTTPSTRTMLSIMKAGSAQWAQIEIA